MLDDVSHAAPQLRLVHAAGVLAVERDRAAGRLDHPVDHPQTRRLPASRRPDEHGDASGGRGERQVLDRDGAARELLRDGVEPDHRCPSRSAAGPTNLAERRAVRGCPGRRSAPRATGCFLWRAHAPPAVRRRFTVSRSQRRGWPGVRRAVRGRPRSWSADMWWWRWAAARLTSRLLGTSTTGSRWCMWDPFVVVWGQRRVAVTTRYSQSATNVPSPDAVRVGRERDDVVPQRPATRRR